jgi:hypothetical protein
LTVSLDHLGEDTVEPQQAVATAKAYVTLLDELAANTIDRQLAKSDIQLGLEYVLGFGPPLPPRRSPS